jgi:hypothetical protein
MCLKLSALSGERIRAMRRLWPILLVAIFAANALATGAKAGCEPDYMPRCQWIEAGDAPLETVAARGDETLRFDYSAFLRPMNRYAIELSRDRAGIVRVTIHAPLVRNASISHVVAPEVWKRVVALRARVIAEDAAAQMRIKLEHPPLPMNRSGRAQCLDPGALSIGSVLGRKVEQIELDDCATRAVDDIADQIHDTLYALLPFCRTLADGLTLQDGLVFGCGSLGGDGAIAARFAPAMLDFSKRDMCAAKAGRAMLAADASLRIADSDKARGGLWHNRAIFAALCRRHLAFRVDRVVAGPDALAVTGRVFRLDETPAASLYPVCETVAAGTQLWRIDGGKAKLEQWAIEKFASVCFAAAPAPMPVRR